MTGAEKFALAKAFHDNAMTGYPPQSQAWVRQQFTALLNGVIDELRLRDSDARNMRALAERDNWLRENPFRDD